jgi:hypothetical protein
MRGSMLPLCGHDSLWDDVGQVCRWPLVTKATPFLLTIGGSATDPQHGGGKPLQQWEDLYASGLQCGFTARGVGKGVGGEDCEGVGSNSERPFRDWYPKSYSSLWYSGVWADIWYPQSFSGYGWYAVYIRATKMSRNHNIGQTSMGQGLSENF